MAQKSQKERHPAREEIVTPRAKIEVLCGVRGLSMRGLAALASITRRRLVAAMHGDALSVYEAMPIARVLQVPVEWLFNDRRGWSDLLVEPGMNRGTALAALRCAEGGAR